MVDVDSLLSKNQNSNKNERTVSRAFVFWFLGLLLVILDQLNKYFIFKVERKSFFSSFFGLQTFRNYDFAFSLELPIWLMYLIYFLVLALIIGFIIKNYHRFNSSAGLAWTLILAGAVSNIGERIYLGYVRDYIYILTGIFNLADIYIIIGILLLLLTGRKFKSINM